MEISGRNKLRGTIRSVRRDGIMAEIILDVEAHNLVTAVITSNAAEDLSLKEGDVVYALIKATSVMIMK